MTSASIPALNMVRALPSDLARLVLDYLNSEGLQNSYNIFLQESPHLEELRSFSSTGILPLGAKDLPAIVEEYYELIEQDSSKVKNTNDALFKLWRRCDALLVQIKHHYKITALPGTTSQAVRSRYSLNRLHHERMQQEREQALQASRIYSLRQLQQEKQCQQQQPQPVNRNQQQEPATVQLHSPQTHLQVQPQSPQQLQAKQQKLLTLHQPQQPQQQQLHTTQSQQHLHQQQEQPHTSKSRQHTSKSRQHLQQQQQQQPPHKQHQQQQQQQATVFPTSHRDVVDIAPMGSSTPRPALSHPEEIASPQQSVSSTQSQFLTPSKDSQSGGEKVIGKSPKRKSAPPRRKVVPGSEERMQQGLASTGGEFPQGSDDIRDLPSPWGSVVNNQELVEKLAENINRMLPNQDTGSDEMADDSLSSLHLQDDQSELPTATTSNRSENLDDILGTMSNTMMNEIVDMTSTDPAFQSLFSLFNTDRERFLSNERQKMSLSQSDIGEDLNTSGESSEDSIAHPDSTLPANGSLPTSGELPSQDHVSDMAGPSYSGPSAGSPGCVVGQDDIMGSPAGEWPQGVIHEPEAQSATTSSRQTAFKDPFPNMVVSRIPAANSKLEDSRLQESLAGHSAHTSGQSRTEKVLQASADSPHQSENHAVRTSKRIVKSLSDYQHVRVLSFDGSAVYSPKQGTAGITRTHLTPSRARAGENSNGRKDGSGGPERSLRVLRNSNESTPSKGQVGQSPIRVYSPKEKIVAQLLTQLPTTPNKGQIHMEAVSPSIFGGRKVLVLSRKKSRMSPARKERTNVSQSGASPRHLSKDGNYRIIGTCVSNLPGHSSAGQSSAVEGRSSQMLPSGTEGAEERQESIVNATSEEPSKKPQKKGVKRDRKGDKNKGSKKSKQSRGKNLTSLAFPDNLDVDKFLSQIHD